MIFTFWNNLLRIKKKIHMAKRILALHSQAEEPNILESNQAGNQPKVTSSMKPTLSSPPNPLLYDVWPSWGCLMLMLPVFKPYLLPP